MCLEIFKTSKVSAFYLSLIGIFSAIIVLSIQFLSKTSFQLFEGHLIVDSFAISSKSVLLIAAGLILMLLPKKFQEIKFYMLFASSVYGAMLMVGSGTFLTLFIGLELMSIPVYVMVMFKFSSAREVEASMKYIVLGGVSSAILLLGISFLYGNSGGIGLLSLGHVQINHETYFITGIILVFMAFFFKASIVPFHGWSPDVYQGATQPVTAYMAAIVKAAIFLSMVRVFGGFQIPKALIGVLVALPLVSVIWGNVGAIWQKSFKRMMAYSSIAHAGYVMFAFLDTTGERSTAIAFYATVYAIMTILAFAAVIYFSDDEEEIDDLESFKGIFKKKPVAAGFMIIAMFSLAGIPPFPGFYAKFFIFKSLVASGYPVLALVAFICSFLGIFFYIRVLVNIFMYTEPEGRIVTVQPKGSVATANFWVLNVMAISLMIILFMSVNPENIIRIFGVSL
ncbi:NADH-quinone oxidoreductase subunit N [Deltaproteobacteria bacterium TL4]